MLQLVGGVGPMAPSNSAEYMFFFMAILIGTPLLVVLYRTEYKLFGFTGAKLHSTDLSTLLVLRT